MYNIPDGDNDDAMSFSGCCSRSLVWTSDFTRAQSPKSRTNGVKRVEIYPDCGV
jgi:hypothetical protein